MTKTMSMRMDRDNYEFLSQLTREERTDQSKTKRELLTRGRVLLAIEKYRSGHAFLGRVAELAGLPLGQVMTVLTDFGVESRIEKEDYFQGLQSLRKTL
jgi:predicted HTH domain antitoxin